MAIKIYFDAQCNPEKPTFNLATRRGVKYAGLLPAENIIVSDRMNDVSEVTFKIRKYANGVKYHLWDYLKDFKLLYCREWNMWLETKVELDEGNETIKTVYGTNLGRSELTNNAILHNIEINTELDISRDDYDPDYPTILYRPDNHPEASLLHRIMEKVPSYKVRYVSPSIANLQRTFTFDGISVYEAFKKLEEEFDCIFVFHTANEDGSICREISVYDLHSWCDACGYRGEFLDQCPKCGNDGKEDNKAIHHGYGNDTTIFVTSDELADNIQYVTDTDSVKNIFYLEAGDDLMTATVRNCLPDGSGYLRGITAETREDMSASLQEELSNYDDDYEMYQTTYETKLNTTSLNAYNILVDKYKENYNLCICYNCGKKSPIEPGAECPNCSSKNTEYIQQLEKINGSIFGYTPLMKAYYDTIDFALFLQSEMMPSVEFSDTTPSKQIQSLQSSLTSVSVQNISTASDTTINSAVLSMAKVIVDSRYDVKIDSYYVEETDWDTDDSGNQKAIAYEWRGYFTVTDLSDESNKASTTYSNGHAVSINGDYEDYVKQKLDKALAKSDTEDMSISGLFDLELTAFKEELNKYCLSRLSSFKDACQTCLDVLIENGAAEDINSDIYKELYSPYRQKLSAIDEELKERESEIQTITGIQDANGKTTQSGIQTYLVEAIEYIRSQLNLETYLGHDLWCELCNYCREDTYSNENYISDGLDNQGLFEMAQSFIEEAKRELFKSANLQHAISCSLKNLLVIEKFKPFVDYFELGNWIRVQIDDNVYRLRLISYEIDYDNLEYISVEFSDVMKTMDGMSDAQSVIEQMQVIGGSYTSVKQQAQKGEESKKVLDNWIYNSMALTNMKIVGNADNQDIVWDTHGLLLRRYYPESDLFDNKQVKFINNGMYFTTDSWETVKTGVGSFMIYNPKTGQTEEAYGVIAETLVGNLILSEEIGVYNTTGSVAIDQDGILVIADATEQANEMSITIQRKDKDEEGNIIVEDIFGVDSDGYLYLNGSVKIQSQYDDVSNIDDLCSGDRINGIVSSAVQSEADGINEQILILQESNDEQLRAYKAEVGQYLTFGGDGLKIGANVNGQESAFSTTLDNQRLSFKENDETVAYINSQQMYIRNAIVENVFAIGNYYFVPMQEDGVVVLWKDKIEATPVDITNSPDLNIDVLEGESFTFRVETSGNVDSIEWKMSIDNQSSWQIVAKNTTTCTVEMPSYETITDDNKYVYVNCIVNGYGGSSVSKLFTITLISTENENINSYSITYNLENYSSSNTLSTIVQGRSYETTLTPLDGYERDTYSITMGGRNINSYFNTTTEKLSISSVTGNVVITIKGKPISTGDETSPVNIDLHPTNVIASDGDIVQFSVTASGGVSELSYQWYYSSNGTSWTKFTGQTTRICSFTATTAMSGRYYKCTVSDSEASIDSNSARLIISNGSSAEGTIVINSMTVPETVDLKDSYTMSVDAVSTVGAELYYQWYYRNHIASSGWGAETMNTTESGTSATCEMFGAFVLGSPSIREVWCVITDSNGQSITTERKTTRFE